MSNAIPERTIYVATIIDSHNYGTVLQAVATKDALAEYGIPVFVDYRRKGWTNKAWLQNYMGGPGNAAVNLARFAASVPARTRSSCIFRSFVEENLALCDSARFLNGGEFESDACYCVGSDQTWNALYNDGIDPVFFLENVPTDCKKISYAASFGRPDIEEAEREPTARLLGRFSAVSVRESSSVAILDSLGVRGGVALKDPVLMCRSALWQELVSDVPVARAGYVLVYMLNPNERMCEYARSLAVKRGIEAKIVTFKPFKPAPKGLRGVCLPTPREWVALFRDASYVITDSFHGTCFSLLFEKPMTVFNPPRFSVRLADVLSDFGLSDRLVADDAAADEIRIQDDAIDWAAVRAAKERFSAEGKAFLDASLT